MILYSENILINYDDKNFTGYNETCHPKKEGIAFWDKRVQPSDNPCVGSILTHVISILCSLIFMEDGSSNLFGKFWV